MHVNWVELIEAEYREMPGMRLSLRQAARLWGLRPEQCRSALEMLVARGTLGRAADGQYGLATEIWRAPAHDRTAA